MKKTIILLLIAFSCNFSLLAETENISYGIFGGYNANIHIADFSKIPDVPNCCPQFDNGFGSGFNFGFLFDNKIDESFFWGLRLGIISLNGTLKKK